jgi:hypothetical protein
MQSLVCTRLNRKDSAMQQNRPFPAIFGTTAAIIFCALSAAPARAQTAEGSFDRTLNVGKQPEVEISTGSGRVEVRSGSGSRVEVTGHIRASDNWGRRTRLSADERVRRLQAAPPVRQQGNVVRIGEIDDDDLRDGVSVSYTVTVPADASVRARTGSGSQRIEGVRGGVHTSTGSGSIVLRDTGGPLTASTGSGSIAADDVNGSFHATTGSGSIRATGIAGPITARTSSGGIEVMQTGNGAVEISSSSGTVRARGIKGALRASTTSGGLNVEGEPVGEWHLGSSSGSVRVDVPDGAAFDLDASSSSGSIDLGMPVSVVGVQGRRSLRGSVKGGGPRLYVRTSSGGIHID